MKPFPLAAALALAVTTMARAAPPDLAGAAAIRDRASAGSGAFDIVSRLTTEVGPRLAGSAAEARARAWALAEMRAMGLTNIHEEAFTVPGWERGQETATVTAPVPHTLALTALGYSGATPAAGLEGEIVGFSSMAAFRAAPAGAVAGKIVFITHRMAATQDGSSYGAFNAIRTRAPALASTRGAAAILIRSLGTGPGRFPHTGTTVWDAGPPRPDRPAAETPAARPIPAAALAVPDSEFLERLLARGPVRVRLVLTPRFTGERPSGNVIGEIRGTERPDEIVLVGGHLDSWDLGTGAIDDGTGIAVSFAAVRAILAHGRPKRTVRLVAWGAEEIGLNGGRAYAARHGRDRHIVGAEHDSGTGRVWKLDTRVAPAALPLVDAMADVLLPLGIARGDNAAGYESDLGPLAPTAMPTLSFALDATGYFAVHHTANDVLDQVDARALDQATAAYAAMLWMVASSDADLGPAPPRDAGERPPVTPAPPRR